MKIHILKFILIAILCTILITMTGCDIINGILGNESEVCEHRDADDDALCDKCAESFTDGDEIVEKPEDEENPDDSDDDSSDDEPACEHVAGDWTIDKEASCEAKGSWHKACTICGVTVESGDIDMLPHTPGEWVTDSDPTCAKVGERHKECTECGETTEREEIAKLTVHTAGAYVEENVTNATCDTDGSYDKVYYCTVTGCGAEISRVASAIPAGHKYVDDVCTECGAFKPSEGLAFISNGDGTCYVSGIGRCKDARIVIPAKHGDYTVTGIGKLAFENQASITSVIIPDSVTSIGDNAFLGCTRITGIVIGSGLESVGYRAFISCYSLVEVINHSSLPITVGSNDYGYLGRYALEIHDGDLNGTVNLNGYLFYTVNSKSYLVGYIGSEGALVLPDGYNGGDYEVNKNAFYGNTSITSVVIPDSVSGIGNNAFFECTSLESAIIGKGVPRILSSTFAYCSSLKTVDLASVGSIEAMAFYQTALTEITVPDSVTKIGDRAFYGCASLKRAVIGHGVTEIYGSAFADCTSLEYVTLGSGITKMGGNVDYGWGGVFENCGNLKGVNIHSITAWCKINFWDETSNPLYYADNLYLVKGNTATLVTELVIPGDVSSIPQYAFPCAGITSVKISEGVRGIGGNAFGKGLTTIELPTSLNRIDSYAFEECVSLLRIDIPASVTKIGIGTFYGCESLTEAILPNGITKIEDRAFLGCSSLTSITLPSGLTEIANKVFSGCAALRSVEIQNGVTVIGESAFEGCNSLRAVKLPESLTTIKANAFKGCSRISSIIIPKNVTSIGGSAFYNCGNLAEVINNSALTFEEGSTSYGCIAYYAIDIHAGSISYIDNVDGYLFFTLYGINYLVGYSGDDTVLTLPESYEGMSYVIKSYAFYNHPSITDVVIPSSVTRIEKYAFSGCTYLSCIVFKDPNGWERTGDASATTGTAISAADLSNTSTAANYLRGSYSSYYWNKAD